MDNPNEKYFQESLITFFRNNLAYEYKSNGELFDEGLREGKEDKEDKKEYLLKPILKESLQQINPYKTEKQINDAIFEIQKINDQDLIQANKRFYTLLKNGIDVINENTKQTEKIFLFDSKNNGNNHFLVVDEFQFLGNKRKRCDIVVFVNGFAVSVIELKNPFAEELNIKDSFCQIKNYQRDIQDLFITNCFNSISNMHISKAGTITSNFERYTSFKSEFKADKFEDHFRGLYSKENLIKIIDNYLIFNEDNQKILCGYHQFYAVNKLIKKSIKAYDKNLENNQQVGVIWHTTGSGKSFTMTFYVKQLLERLKPLVIVLTDRIDLDDQLFQTFAKCREFLNIHQGLLQIKSREDLIDKIQGNTKSNIIFTTIQKFYKEENKPEFEELSKREDIFIIVDEAHRTQYDLQDGLARHIRNALPYAKFVGFTGTPIDLAGRNTKLIFGNYIDQYTIKDAVKDKTTVPIHYEARLAKIGLKEDQLPIIDEKAQELFERAGVDEEKAKMETIIGASERLNLVAKDFITHYQARQKDNKGKVMFCCFSRKVAVAFYDILIKQKPDYQNIIKVIFSGSSSDRPEYQDHIRNDREKKEAERLFKDSNDKFSIAIVVDMWQTGFDVPCLHTLYIDKPLKEHTLIQAISRVNRVYESKTSGLIVDYIGIGDFLKQALSKYSNEDQEKIEIDFEKVIKLLIEKYELTKSYFNGFDYSQFLTISDKEKRLEILRDGFDFILGKEKQEQQNFLTNTLELSKTYSLCPLSEEAKNIVGEINYFKCVRNGILQKKIIGNNKEYKIDLEKELSSLISQSIESQGVINIYDLAGIENPQIDILSEDFFDKIRSLKQKNLALELLKKILNDKIKTITKGNVALEKRFSEKLKALVIKYYNKTLSRAEVIEEVINIVKEIQQEPERIKKINLSEDEVKFYDAVSRVNDEKEVMDTKILKELAKELVEQIRKNKTIDWDKKESTRAKMRLIIKKLLKKYKYPPEGQEQARDSVLEQAKAFCEDMN